MQWVTGRDCEELQLPLKIQASSDNITPLSTAVKFYIVPAHCTNHRPNRSHSRHQSTQCYQITPCSLNNTMCSLQSPILYWGLPLYKAMQGRKPFYQTIMLQHWLQQQPTSPLSEKHSQTPSTPLTTCQEHTQSVQTSKYSWSACQKKSTIGIWGTYWENNLRISLPSSHHPCQQASWVGLILHPTHKPDGNFHICTNSIKPSQKSIIRQEYKFHMVNEISHWLSAATTFSKVYANDVFGVFILMKEAHISTYSTPIKVFVPLHTIQLKMSKDVFQMQIVQVTDRLPGILMIHDDMCISDHTTEEYNKYLIHLILNTSGHKEWISFWQQKVQNQTARKKPLWYCFYS